MNQPAPESNFDEHNRDEFAGKGGSYEVDPVSGRRRLVSQTLPTDAAGAPIQTSALPGATAADSE